MSLSSQSQTAAQLQRSLDKQLTEASALELNLKDQQSSYESQISRLQRELAYFRLENSQMGAKLSILREENSHLKAALLKLRSETLSLSKQLDESGALLGQLSIKNNLQKDLNSFFRDFYARNVTSKMNQEDFDKYLSKGVADFAAAHNHRGDFIKRELEKVEEVVNKL